MDKNKVDSAVGQDVVINHERIDMLVEGKLKKSKDLYTIDEDNVYLAFKLEDIRRFDDNDSNFEFVLK
jgi:hypothetical protein